MGLLRLFLAICVFFNHVPSGIFHALPSGMAAVESFFIISGFYIAMVWTEKYSLIENSKTIFLVNRWLRLAPAYIAVSLIVVTVSIFKTGSFHGIGGASPIDILLTAISHITLIAQDVFNFMIYDFKNQSFHFANDVLINPNYTQAGIVSPAWYFLAIGQGWSVGVEMWFYLTAPFFVLLKNRYLTLLVLLSLSCKLFIHFEIGLTYDPWVMRFFPSELLFFIFGIFAFRFYSSHRSQWKSSKMGWILLASLLLVGVVFGEYFCTVPNPTQKLSYFFSYSYQLLVLMSLPLIFWSSRNSKWDNWIAQLSYPFYILHLFCLELLNLKPWLAFGATLVFSLFVVYSIEKPIDKIRARLTKRGIKIIS